MNETVPKSVSYGLLISEMRKRIRKDKIESKDYFLDLLQCLHHLEERTIYSEKQRVEERRRR